MKKLIYTKYINPLETFVDVLRSDIPDTVQEIAALHKKLSKKGITK